MIYELLYNGNGLWYLKDEGKVRREWVSDVCQRAGLSRLDLEKQPNVWHKVQTR